MAGQIDLYWILSVLFCAWAGYRLAEYYELNPVAGLTLGAAINVLIATDFSSWGGNLTAGTQDVRVLSVYFAILLCFSFLLLAGKRKAWALLKIGGLVTLIAVAFSFVPRSEARSPVPGFALPPGVIGEPIARSQLPPQVSDGVKRSQLGFQTLALARRQSDLFHSVFAAPTRGGASVDGGTWVLVRRSVRGRDGRDWVEILLPDSNGDYREGRSRMGFVPADVLVFRVPVPGLSD